MTQNIIATPVETIVRTTGSQSIAGTKTFSDPTILQEITNPLVENLTPVPLSANSGTISAGQLISGVIVFTPTADATWTFPLGSDVDTALNVPSANRGRKGVRFVNNSAFSVTFIANTGMNLNGLSTTGTLFLPPHSNVTFDLEKVDTSPTYTTFGASYGSLSYLEQAYLHTTNWTGIWSSDQTGNCYITRIADQVFLTLPLVSSLTNTAALITNVTAIPARFRPSSELYIGVPSIINSANTNGVGNGAAKVSSAGVITIYQAGSNTAFPSGQTCGFQRQALQWSVI